ncbi:alpha/beta hydrolase [Hellea balneolensis]|uniref:alpha/beta hydrolase n=1 Tax=Hellea balneolensis TaxID=287478 RepID=UPI00040F5F7D|nr:alpha/beta hydrolase [Hellea balneolensis]
MQSFNSSTSWVTYRKILKTEFSIDTPQEIVEHRKSILGHLIRLDVWEPDQHAKGTIIFVHGAGGNGRLVAPFIQGLEELGWRIIAPDLPGYGLTIPRINYNWSYEEWPKIIAKLADEQHGPVVLLGASMGGLTAVHSAEWTNNISGIIVTTLVDLSDAKVLASCARWPILGWLFIFGIKFIPRLLDPIRIPLSLVAPMKSMNANQKMKRYFTKDKLLGANWKPFRFWRSVFNYHKKNIQLSCPLLLIHPGDDDWTPIQLSLDRLESIEAQKDYKILTNGGHLPLEAPAIDELRNHIASFIGVLTDL